MDAHWEQEFADAQVAVDYFIIVSILLVGSSMSIPSLIVVSYLSFGGYLIEPHIRRLMHRFFAT